MSGESVWHFCNTETSFSPGRTTSGGLAGARTGMTRPNFGPSSPRFDFAGGSRPARWALWTPSASPLSGKAERWKFPATLSSAPMPPSACVPVAPFSASGEPPTIPNVSRTERRALPRRPNRPGLAEGAGCGKGFGSDHARRKEMPCDSSSPASSRFRVVQRQPSPRPRRENGVARARRRPRRYRPAAADRWSADGHERVSRPHGRRPGRGSGRRA